MSDDFKYVAGDIILIEHGFDRSISVSHVLRALKDFDLKQVSIQYHATFGNGNPPAQFGPFIVSLGLAEDLDYQEAEVSDEGDLYAWLYCQHENKTFHYFDGRWGMMACCDFCREQFPDTRRPATAEELADLKRRRLI